jgi:hypothetical protein
MKIGTTGVDHRTCLPVGRLCVTANCLVKVRTLPLQLLKPSLKNGGFFVGEFIAKKTLFAYKD